MRCEALLGTRDECSNTKEGGRAEFKLLTTAPLNHSQRQALFRGARYGIPVHSTGGVVCVLAESHEEESLLPVDQYTVDARCLVKFELNVRNEKAAHTPTESVCL